MMKWEAGAKTYFEWVAENLSQGARIGFDATQIGPASFRNRSKYFKDKGLEMVSINDRNLVDEVWGADKPPVPQGKAFIHEEKYAGSTVQEKYVKVAAKLEKKVDVLLVTTLDDIDWVLNMRGTDISYNPVFISYLLFHPALEEG